MIKGIDCAVYNKPDWDKLTGLGYKFAFIKVTDGTSGEDPKWKEHYNNAIGHGWYVGPYHYFRPQYGGVAQADHMNSVASEVDWDFGWTCDVEEESGNPGKSIYGSRVKDFLATVSNHGGRKPIVYTSKYKWEKLTGGIAVDADLWTAHWTDRAEPLIPYGFNKWIFWQWTVDREMWLDLDRFWGTEEDLDAYVGDEIVYEATFNVPRNADKIILHINRIL